MKKTITWIIFTLIVSSAIYVSFYLIEFNEYRFTVTNNLGYIPFEDNIKMMKWYPNLQSLEFTNTDIKKIRGLNNLKDLKVLTISGSGEVTKIEGLNNLHNLQELTLDDNSIETIEGLSGLNRIERIILDDNYITTIENIEEIPLMKNDYCYIVPISMQEKKENIYTDTEAGFSIENGFWAEECFLEAEPEVYIDKYLYNENYEYGEMVSPLSKGYISLSNNNVKYITQESYDYIKKYNVSVVIDNQYYKEGDEIIFFDNRGGITSVDINDLEII